MGVANRSKWYSKYLMITSVVIRAAAHDILGKIL